MFKLVRNINNSKLLLLFSNCNNNNNCLFQLERTLYLTNVNQLKRIEKTIDEAKKTITFEGKFIHDETKNPSLATKLAYKSIQNDINSIDSQSIHKFDTGDDHQVKPCSFCLLEKENIYVQYTDIPVLRQFLKDDGSVLHRKITGLCKRQQRKLLVLVKQAKQAGLLLSLQPKLIDGSDAAVEPSKRKEFLKYNSYYDSYEIMKRTNKYL